MKLFSIPLFSMHGGGAWESFTCGVFLRTSNNHTLHAKITVQGGRFILILPVTLKTEFRAWKTVNSNSALADFWPTPLFIHQIKCRLFPLFLSTFKVNMSSSNLQTSKEATQIDKILANWAIIDKKNKQKKQPRKTVGKLTRNDGSTTYWQPCA